VSRDDAIHRFFSDKRLIAAVCKRCGKLVAVYEGHNLDCQHCAVTDDERWRPTKRCRCDPPPVLPAGTEMAAKIAQADAAERKWLHRAPIKIYI
jgi:hypothetical protein